MIIIINNNSDDDIEKYIEIYYIFINKLYFINDIFINTGDLII